MFASYTALIKVVSGKNGKERKVFMAKRGPQPGTPEAQKGGQSVRAKYGGEFFKKIGKKGGDTVKARYGQEFFEKIGKKGGETTKARHGIEFFERIGKKGGRR